MSANLKREILRLLREDEEFRYAVAGLLGLEDIRSALAELAEAVKELTKAVHALDSRTRSLESGLEAVKSDVATLKSDVATLKSDVNALKVGYEKLRREVRSMRRTLENLTISEEEANLVVTHLLREKGVSLETAPTAFDKKYGFDVYGTTGELTVIGEAKVRAGSKAVRKLAERIEEARRRWPEKLPGKVVKVLYCLRAAPGTAEEAEKLGVWLIESMREKTKPQL